MYAKWNCDFPGCGLPIVQKCVGCGLSYCVRHINWIPIYDLEGYYAGGYYACAACANALIARDAQRTRAVILTILTIAFFPIAVPVWAAWFVYHTIVNWRTYSRSDKLLYGTLATVVAGIIGSCIGAIFLQALITR